MGGLKESEEVGVGLVLRLSEILWLLLVEIESKVLAKSEERGRDFGTLKERGKYINWSSQRMGERTD